LQNSDITGWLIATGGTDWMTKYVHCNQRPRLSEIYTVSEVPFSETTL
jgi:hypothetical protein